MDHQAMSGAPGVLLASALSNTVKKGLFEGLAFWQRVFKVKLVDGPKMGHVYEMIGSLSRAFDIEGLKNLTMENFADIPNDRAIVGIEIVRRPLFSGNNSRKVNQAIKKVLEAVKQGRAPNANQLITIADALHKKVMFKPVGNSINNRGARLLATQSYDEIMHLIQQAITAEETTEHLKNLQVKVLSVPKTDLPANMVYVYNRDIDPSLHTGGITPSAMQTLLFESNRALTVPLMMLTGVLAYVTYHDYERFFTKQGFVYSVGKNLAILGGCIAAIGSVREEYSRSAQSHALTKARAQPLAKLLTPILKKQVKFTYLRTFNGVVGILSGTIGIMDTLELANNHDKDAAAATLIAGGLSIGSGIYGIFFTSLALLLKIKWDTLLEKRTPTTTPFITQKPT